tara:strand:- start:2700 stop:4073 length:1374 start_codon:yes stop_codon:yes gene_type:complete
MKNREQWNSNLGFILAASGSAVGVGNIWKFPTMAGENGGAAFTFIYLLCIFIVGLSILLGELLIGRKTQLSAVGAYKKLSKNKFWVFNGFLGTLSAVVILSFYGVVGGWTLKYTFLSLFGFLKDLNIKETEMIFSDFISLSFEPIFWQISFMLITMFVIINGVKNGIEKWSKIMMPFVIFLLIILALRGIITPGGIDGLKFLFYPKFEDLTPHSIVLALGHSFFTLSLGMGTMVAYGSYINKKQDLLVSSIWIIFLDTFIALIAGIAIFTTVFATGSDPASGPGLIFTVLPTVFNQLIGGQLWSTLFFLLLFMAALTSAISLLEVVTAYFVDEKKWSRPSATITFGFIIILIGVFCSFSLGGGINISPFENKTFFDLMDELSSKYMLPIGGLLVSLFIIFEFKISNFIDEINKNNSFLRLNKTFTLIIFTISSIVVGYILINEVYFLITGSSLIGKI